MTDKRSANGLYSVHPGVTMMQDWVATLKAKTGRTLEEWVDFTNAEGPPDEPSRGDWLKKDHGLGTNSAWWIAQRSVGRADEDSDPDVYLASAERWVEEMFAGKRSEVRPLYDRLLVLGLSIAPDVKACPCKTIVPLYRNHVVAQIKPTTNTRIDMGYALRDTPATGRLIDTGGFAKKDRITHRIPITSLDDIDDEVTHWIRKAYEMDAKP